MSLAEDIAESRDYEMHKYLDCMESMYGVAVQQNGEIYDIAFRLTDGFSSIDAQAILEDSRVIKPLRYSIAPTISQMKFGQLFGLNSIDSFENDRVTVSTAKYKQLQLIAEKISEFARSRIDRSRFIWLDDPTLQSPLATEYAKKWTCSIAADQNAQTAYRNWRKELQEHKVVSALISAGYIKSSFRGTVSKNTDINIGEYTKEIKIQGRTVQKADVVFRSKVSQKLVLVEAKAVGVELDAAKRIKECKSKAGDWASADDLDSPLVVAVIAGFFTIKNISDLEASNVRVVWEHRLSDLDLL